MYTDQVMLIPDSLFALTLVAPPIILPGFHMVLSVYINVVDNMYNLKRILIVWSGPVLRQVEKDIPLEQVVQLGLRQYLNWIDTYTLSVCVYVPSFHTHIFTQQARGVVSSFFKFSPRSQTVTAPTAQRTIGNDRCAVSSSLFDLGRPPPQDALPAYFVPTFRTFRRIPDWPQTNHAVWVFLKIIRWKYRVNATMGVRLFPYE